MSTTKGISFLHQFDLGNRDLVNPGQKIISVTSTAAGDFDKANMFEDSTRKIWRSAGVLQQEIVIQADLTTQIDTFFIGGHNFTSSAVITIQANIDNNFAAPTFSQVVPVPARGKNLVLAQDFAASFEFYKIIILDPTNPCGFVEMGRVVGGRSFIFSAGSTKNEDITDNFSVSRVDRSKKMTTEGFFRQSNEMIVHNALSLNFKSIQTVAPDNVNYEGMQDLFENVKTTKPFLTVIDRDNPSFFPLWGQLATLPTDSFTVEQRVSFPLRIEEVS